MRMSTWNKEIKLSRNAIVIIHTHYIIYDVAVTLTQSQHKRGTRNSIISFSVNLVIGELQNNLDIT